MPAEVKMLPCPICQAVPLTLCLPAGYLDRVVVCPVGHQFSTEHIALVLAQTVESQPAPFGWAYDGRKSRYGDK